MFSVVEILACPNRPLTADTGTWSAISKVALEWRKLWKWAEVRSFAFKNLLNQLVMLWGSNGAPSTLVKIRSFLMVLPHISTVRTHADPMRKRCSRCIWRYSRSSSIQLSPTRIIRRERLVLGGAKTTPAPGILCIDRSKRIVARSCACEQCKLCHGRIKRGRSFEGFQKLRYLVFIQHLNVWRFMLWRLHPVTRV